MSRGEDSIKSVYGLLFVFRLLDSLQGERLSGSAIWVGTCPGVPTPATGVEL